MYKENQKPDTNKKSKGLGKTDKPTENICSRTQTIDVLIGMANDLKKLLEIIEEREKTRKGM